MKIAVKSVKIFSPQYLSTNYFRKYPKTYQNEEQKGIESGKGRAF